MTRLFILHHAADILWKALETLEIDLNILQ